MSTRKQRREAERRRLRRQAERRSAQDVRRQRALVALTVVNVLVAVGAVTGLLLATSGDDAGSSKAGGSSRPEHTSTAGNAGPTPTAPNTPKAGVAAYPCTWTRSGTPARAVKPPATTTPPRSGTVRAEVRTSRGQLEFTLDRKAAPCAVASFLSLAAQGFYDRTQCHRLTTGPTLFVLTCGDPSGTGGGGPGYSFGVELTGKEKYVQGVLALVNRGANTNGSQFLIVYRDSQLPASYTIFGRVTSGLGVVQKVAAGGALSGADGKPKFPVSLLQISPVA